MKTHNPCKMGRSALSFAGSISSVAVAVMLFSVQPAMAADDSSDDDSKDSTILVLGQSGTRDAYKIERSTSSTGMPLTLKETPQTITVMTRQMLDDMDIDSMDQALNATPGISSVSSDTGGRTTYRTRGFAITNYRIDGAQVDGGAGLSSPGAAFNFDLADNIQVVRGANGLLGGTGDPSATVYINRKRAGKDLKINVAATLGNWDRKKGLIDASIPITHDGSIRARLVYSHEDTDTFRDREHLKRRAALANFDVDLTDSTVLNFGVQYEKTDNAGVSWGPNVPVWFSDGTLTNLPRNTNPSPDWSTANRDTTTRFVRLEQKIGQDWNVAVSFNRMTSNVFNNYASAKVNNDEDSKKGTTGYWNKDGTGAFINVLHSENESARNNLDITVNGTVSLFGREHMLMAGFNGYENEVVEYGMNCSLGGLTSRFGCQFRSGLLPVNDWRTWDGSYAPFEAYRTGATTTNTIRNYGGYAATRLNIADQLKVILGARLSDYRASTLRKGTDGAIISDVVGQDNAWVFTPYAGVLYDLTSTISAYASYTSVFAPQGLLYDENDDLLAPVTGNSYEGGLKGSFFNGALDTSIAYYYNKQSNVAEALSGVTTPMGRDAYTTVDGVVTKGVDVTAAGQILPGWRVNAGYTYTKVNGLAYQRDPAHMIRVSTSYTLPGAFDRLTIGGNISTQSKTVFTTNPGRPIGIGDNGRPQYDNSRLDNKGYTLVGLMANYKVDDNFSISANVSNLFDTTYYRQYGFYAGMIYGEPRSFSVTLRGSF